jgi:phosphatidylinositol dimannoside acyltransferase
VSGFTERLAGIGYSLGWSLIRRAPESLAAEAFRFFGDVAWRRQGPSVQVLEGNLRRVLGPEATGAEIRAVSRESMRSYARYWLEVFRLPVMPMSRLNAGMNDNGHILDAFAYLKAGRGVIFALPHMGNWDQAGAWFIAAGAGSFTTVMERVKPESLYEQFVEFREGLGMEVLPASGGDRPFGILARRLRSAKVVCLPCDRDITGHGLEVEFFGEPARMAAGPAALAVQTGAALMPVILWFEEDGGWGGEVNTAIPVPETGDRKERVRVMTQEVARIFEDGIRQHPQDWHMLQRVFTADLDADRLAAAERKAGLQSGAGQAGAAQSGNGQAGAESAAAAQSDSESAGAGPGGLADEAGGG